MTFNTLPSPRVGLRHQVSTSYGPHQIARLGQTIWVLTNYCRWVRGVRKAEIPMVISLLRMHSAVVVTVRCGCYLRIAAVFRVLQSGVPRSKPAAVRCRQANPISLSDHESASRFMNRSLSRTE